MSDSLGSSNGGRRTRPVVPSELFERRLAEVAEHVPGVHAAVDAARLQLELDPTWQARRLAGEGLNWTIKTTRARGVDALYLYYTIRADEIVLQWVDSAERDIPTRLSGNA